MFNPGLLRRCSAISDHRGVQWYQKAKGVRHLERKPPSSGDVVTVPGNSLHLADLIVVLQSWPNIWFGSCQWWQMLVKKANAFMKKTFQKWIEERTCVVEAALREHAARCYVANGLISAPWTAAWNSKHSDSLARCWSSVLDCALKKKPLQ